MGVPAASGAMITAETELVLTRLAVRFGKTH
jgi:hypothetical protein